MLSGAPVFFLKSQEAQARRGDPGRADAIDQAEGLMALRELLYSAAFDFASAFRAGSFQSGRMKWQV